MLKFTYYSSENVFFRYLISKIYSVLKIKEL